MDQNELLKIFYEEAEEHLQLLESGLLQIEDIPDDPEIIDTMFRAAHTLKGSAGIVGLTPVSEITHVMENLLEKFRQPVLVETFLPGREFTVGILGTGEGARALKPMEVVFLSDSQSASYSYETKKNYLDKVEYRLVAGELGKACEEVALAAWRGLGCRDGGRIDVRLDTQGVPNFIEVNPLAGLNPIDSDLPILCRLSGITYQSLIKQIMDSALERLENQPRIQSGPHEDLCLI